MELYNKIIIEAGRDGSFERALEHPSLVEHSVNPSCGDKITIEIELENGRIKDLAAKTEGCIISKAATHMLLTEISGKTRAEAQKIVQNYLAFFRAPDAKRELSAKDASNTKNVSGAKSASTAKTAPSPNSPAKLPEALIPLKPLAKNPARVNCALLPARTLIKAMADKV